MHTSSYVIPFCSRDPVSYTRGRYCRQEKGLVVYACSFIESSLQKGSLLKMELLEEEERSTISHVSSSLSP